MGAGFRRGWGYILGCTPKGVGIGEWVGPPKMGVGPGAELIPAWLLAQRRWEPGGCGGGDRGGRRSLWGPKPLPLSHLGIYHCWREYSTLRAAGASITSVGFSTDLSVYGSVKETWLAACECGGQARPAATSLDDAKPHRGLRLPRHPQILAGYQGAVGTSQAPLKSQKFPCFRQVPGHPKTPGRGSGP